MGKLTFAACLVVPVLVLAAGSPVPWSSPAAAETARIRARLVAVERSLRAKDVSAWSPTERIARSRNLEVLHEYWVRGVFPRNTSVPGARVPIFVDRYGTRCAMAYLIERSGRSDLVARVAGTNNYAWIRDLKADPELVAWLRANGLTVGEAALIQPSYDGGWFTPPPDAGAASVGYKTTTGVAVGASVVTLALNIARTRVSPKLSAVLGIASGAMGLAAGEPNLSKTGSRRALGFVNTGVGAASVLLGVYRFTRAPRTTSRASAVPWLDGQGVRGVCLSVSF